ncbi:hypothetical protein WA538_005629, partial [Blastocystis sp. DL]
MVKNDSFRGYMIHVIKETTEDTEELQAVGSAIYYCISSKSNDVRCFVVSITPYILYSYMRSYAEQKPLLSLEICLQKIVYVESQVTTKKSQEPSLLFSSMYHTATSAQSHSLTSDNLEQFQRVLNTDREELPSQLKGMTDSYNTYILATLTMQCRYLPFVASYEDVFLSLYLILLDSANDQTEFSPIMVYSPPADKAICRICDALKALRSIKGTSSLWRKCAESVKKLANQTNNETV